MKNEIIELLSHHPNGLRLREIGAYLRVYHIKLIKLIGEMESEGIITGKPNTDHANGEYYITWYLVG